MIHLIQSMYKLCFLSPNVDVKYEKSVILQIALLQLHCFKWIEDLSGFCNYRSDTHSGT